MFALIAAVVLVLLLIATAWDLATREVPDWISIVVALIAVVTSLIGWLGLSIAWVLAGGAAGLLAGYALFRFAEFGGADAKLIAAIGFLVGPVGLVIILFGMALAGGALSLVAMLRGKRDLAYVPAITAGFLGYLGLVSWL